MPPKDCLRFIIVETGPMFAFTVFVVYLFWSPTSGIEQFLLLQSWAKAWA